jgi:hypothetical protein
MAEEAEAYYVANYIKCFSMEDVATALAQIPQVGRRVVGVWLGGWCAAHVLVRQGARRRCKCTAGVHCNVYCFYKLVSRSVVSRLFKLQVMMWDDHDIWDGYGSYDPEMQQSAVFQVGAAKRLRLNRAACHERPCVA